MSMSSVHVAAVAGVPAVLAGAGAASGFCMDLINNKGTKHQIPANSMAYIYIRPHSTRHLCVVCVKWTTPVTTGCSHCGPYIPQSAPQVQLFVFLLSNFLMTVTR